MDHPVSLPDRVLLADGSSFKVQRNNEGFAFEGLSPASNNAAWGVYLATDDERGFRTPTLRDDGIAIFQLDENRPVETPALALYATLLWYFQLPRPQPQLDSPEAASTVLSGKPKGDWRVKILARDGLAPGRVLTHLERLGLIAHEDTSVGTDPAWGEEEPRHKHYFASEPAFWQLNPRDFQSVHVLDAQSGDGAYAGNSIEYLGPRAIAPQQWRFTGSTRHPIRSQPPRQGETFYQRYVPSLDEVISFRVVSLADRPVIFNGPIGIKHQQLQDYRSNVNNLTDVQLLHKWMNDERVASSWGEQGPIEHQRAFLKTNLESQHSFPVIGCFDGKPFGYFELYWVLEDKLGRQAPNVGAWDRGVHLLVGEQEFRGKHRVKVWLSSLCHYLFTNDPRTQKVMAEPRVDNVKLKEYMEANGFMKVSEVTFPHKQSNCMVMTRENFVAPGL